jgi:protein-S-isoprenylcysteine O-methyltransferase Ste14
MYKGPLLVFAQFTLIILIFMNGDTSQSWTRTAGIGLGLLLGIWAIIAMRLRVSVLPEPTYVSNLTVRGPYRFIRHPMYTAVLLCTAACVINLLTAVLWLALATILITKLRYEEGLLLKKFPDYKNYMKKTKRLLPYIW